MADKNYEISILLSAIDGTSGVLSKTSEEINKMGDHLQTVGYGLTGVGAAITGAFALAVKNAGDEELALERLQRAIENNGYQWEIAKNNLDGYINSTSILTKYSDDELAAALQKALVYTNDLAGAQQNVSIAIDMAASGMFDLEGAIRIVGMAQSGNVEMLGRWIPEMKSANLAALGITTEADKAAYAIEILGQKFGGMAEGEAKTLNGALSILFKNIGELGETIAAIFVPQLTEAATMIGNVVQAAEEWANENPLLAAALAALTSSIGLYAGAIGGAVLVLPTLISLMKALYVVILENPYTAAAAGLAILITATINYFDAASDATDKQEKFNESLKTGKIDQVALAAAIDDTRNTYKSFYDGVTLNIDGNLVKMDSQKKKWGEMTYAIDDNARSLRMNLDIFSIYATQFLEASEKFVAVFQDIGKAVDAYYKLQTVDSTNAKNMHLRNLEETYWNERNKQITTVEDEKELNKALLKIDADYNLAKLGINNTYDEEVRKQKQQYKEWAKAAAWISGAVAVLKTFETYGGTPWGYASAAAIAIETALQVKLIDAQQFAGGVRNYSGGMAIVGEEGPELVRLPGGSDVFTNRESRGMMGGINVYVSGNYILDEAGADGLADRVGEVILQKVRNERFV